MWNHSASLIRTLSLICLLGITTATTALATNPRATRISPHVAKIGTEVVVTISGDRLNDAEEIVCGEPGLSFQEFTVPEDKNGKIVTAKIVVAADSPLGNHRLRVRTKSGISELLNFQVTPYDVVEEKEPNTEFTAPQEITTNVTIQGRIDNEDVDYFVLDCKQGDRLSAEVEGLRLGTVQAGNFFDPYVAILNESRFELVAMDDHALSRQDAFVSFIVPEDGKYIVMLRDSSYGGNGNAYYSLHVGNFARATGVFPAGGQPGQTINVKFMGDPAGDFEQQVTLPTQKPLEFAAHTVQNGLVTPTGNPLWVSELNNVLEQEPNENLEQATPLTLPGAGNGVLTTGADLDYFKVTLKKDQEIDVDVIARRVRSSIDSVVNIYNSKGGRVAGDDDRKRPDSWVRYKATEDGDYYIKVNDQLLNGGPDYYYRIEVTPVTPAMAITVNDIARYVQPDIVVPRGRRMAYLASVQRENFGGAVHISGQGLAEGVTVETPESWVNDGVIPIMFNAPVETPLSTAFATVEGKWQHPSNAAITAQAKVQQAFVRVRGQNNQFFWQEYYDAVPVTVTEEVPFDVQIVTPNVPIVRGGTMNLKVVATRKEGFDEPIQVLVLQNPPGVNSSRSIKIEKGQNEALIPFNASGNAPIRESMITVHAIAKVGDGNVEICTPFAPLSVAEMYMKFNYVNVAVDQGSSVSFPVTIENVTPFEGTAQVELIGLPAKTTTTPLEITKDSTEIAFPITTEADAPLGETKNLFCRVTVMQGEEPVVHQLGTGRLRINKPAPAPVAKPAAPAQPEVKKEETPKPKVLSRLEMLREQQEALRQQMGN